MKFILSFFIPLIAVPAFAKIADAPGVSADGRLFCSHGNVVFALKTKDENFKCSNYGDPKTDPKRIWKTRLAFKTGPDKKDPKLEADVQWCNVTSLTLEASDVIAADCRGNKYRLTQKTGSMIKK